MDRSNVIYLVSEEYTQDEIGQYVSTETKRMVFCDVRSITRAEWFEAGRNGMQPSFVFVIFGPDYQDEKIVEYNGSRYGVYRTYAVRNDQLELFVEGKGGIDGGNQSSSEPAGGGG